MTLSKAQKLIIKLYHELKAGKTVTHDEVNGLGNFLDKNRFCYCA
ncbi:MAG: hypothetical protein Q8O10_10385 [candidate division Zixibacteria bacterium]|nr:hypothetical protein [candidate division Zixibacteria bacterium]